jgi:hypothetical protein
VCVRFIYKPIAYCVAQSIVKGFNSSFQIQYSLNERPSKQNDVSRKSAITTHTLNTHKTRAIQILEECIQRPDMKTTMF